MALFVRDIAVAIKRICQKIGRYRRQARHAGDNHMFLHIKNMVDGGAWMGMMPLGLISAV
jgi:hypothetical protein